MVTLGFIDPDNYLGGRVQLKPENSARGARPRASASASAGRPRRRPPRCTTWSSSTWPTRSARSASARATTRASSCSWPTAAPCRCSPRRSPSGSGITTIVIPQNSSVFCALGLLSADYVMRIDQGVGWDLSKPEGVDRVNEIAEQMVADGDRADGVRGLRRATRSRSSARRDLRFHGPGLRADGADARPRADRRRRAGRSSTSSSSSTSGPTARARRGRASRRR